MAEKELQQTQRLDFGKGGIENIKFPNVGELMRIESTKGFTTFNNYNNINSNLALDIADTISTFRILLPDLEKKFEFESYENMPLSQIVTIVKVYKDQYLPWYKQWMTFIENITKDINSEK